ncbi:MAG: hypothetical protein ACHP85_13410 [Burkholderiales bacterium]
MKGARSALALALGLGALGAPAAAQQARQPAAQPAPQEQPNPVRDGLEALEARLDRAVDRVSLPHAARLLGRAEVARGYRLPGYGLVLVLTPRALPGGEGQVYFFGPGKTRRMRVDKRQKGASQTVVVNIDDSDGLETFERQVLVLQPETEAARLAAEQEMDRIAQDVRVRIAPPLPPEAPPTPEAAPAPLPPQAPVAVAAPVAAPVPPVPPVAWTAAPPPWKFWFEAGSPAETREPAAVIADVRASLVDTLVAADAATLAGLGADERVTVAVDFVSGGLFVANARPSRTLLVSVRGRDVAARGRGAISAEELRRRVEVSEY